MRPVRAFEVVKNVATVQLWIYNCRSKISFKLQQNEIDFAALGYLCWSIWTFKLSELRRPVLNQERGLRC